MKVLKVLSVIILVFIVTFSINKFMLSIERNKIVGYREKIEIKGKNINIVEKGLENNQVVIIDPGYGTTAPGLGFMPLMDELFQTYHVIAIEPFGYGDSDTIGTPRTVENITDELHQVIQKLGYTKYILCSHSISGVYSLYYLDKYQDEVTGFIGMDTSVPNQLEYTGNTFLPILRKWSNKLGLIRIASRIHPEWFMANNQYYTDATKSQIRYRLYMDFANVDNLDEGRHFADNWNKIKDLHYQRNIKKIFFLTKKEDKDKDWRYIETQNAFEKNNGKIYLMDGSHYIFRDNFMKMSQIIRESF
ncbi:MAG: alpha/beta hydrolase [Finegoldia magna]|uniref:alpha/beta fold hydrolase n=1 Tax=Finegoldia magna TaxID=1260 RepID=UPI001CE13CE3|nr:alpha/beta hydrolase [Finegoldia magna]MCA5587472.1 alpha/beta hydrolase [Finegoldia magna]MDU2709181.1 alpha/beta hydrolase [Finegoldia magna]